MKFGAYRDGRVFLGTQEVTGVCERYQVTYDGEKQSLIVELREGADITGEGIVYVSRQKIDPLEFLNAMDPEELQEEALYRLQWHEPGEEEQLAKLILDVLKEKLLIAEATAEGMPT